MGREEREREEAHTEWRRSVLAPPLPRATATQYSLVSWAEQQASSGLVELQGMEAFCRFPPRSCPSQVRGRLECQLPPSQVLGSGVGPPGSQEVTGGATLTWGLRESKAA